MADTIFKIVWDNGLGGSGEFPYEFASEADAERWGNDWVVEMCAIDQIPGDAETAYSFEVVAAERSNPPPVKVPEVWTACIQLSLLGPMVIGVRKRKAKRSTAIPVHVAEFLGVERHSYPARLADMSNDAVRALKPALGGHPVARAARGDILKISERHHGMRRWVTFKL